VSRILVRLGGDVNPDVGDDKETNCVAVHPGRASVNTIEIPDGLKPRDQVIVSDMSPRDRSLRIRLN
jgi:hypothetical protein